MVAPHNEALNEELESEITLAVSKALQTAYDRGFHDGTTQTFVDIAKHQMTGPTLEFHYSEYAGEEHDASP